MEEKEKKEKKEEEKEECLTNWHSNDLRGQASWSKKCSKRLSFPHTVLKKGNLASNVITISALAKIKFQIFFYPFPTLASFTNSVVRIHRGHHFLLCKQ